MTYTQKYIQYPVIKRKSEDSSSWQNGENIFHPISPTGCNLKPSQNAWNTYVRILVIKQQQDYWGRKPDIKQPPNRGGFPKFPLSGISQTRLKGSLKPETVPQVKIESSKRNHLFVIPAARKRSLWSEKVRKILWFLFCFVSLIHFHPSLQVATR